MRVGPTFVRTDLRGNDKVAYKIEVSCDPGQNGDQFKDRCYEIRTVSGNGWMGQVVLVGNDGREDNWTDELEVRDGQIVLPARDSFDDNDDYYVTRIVDTKLTYSEVAEYVHLMFE